jgi:hypothetical protein
MEEFSQERAAIAYQISLIKEFDINAAESWGAGSATVEEIYLQEVRKSHIYIGLFGKEYSAATHREYEEAYKNPYRQKLTYIKKVAKHAPQLIELIKTLQLRHKPYLFEGLGDLLPQLRLDLISALERIADQILQMGETPPVSQSAARESVSLRAWQKRQNYLKALYEQDCLNVANVDALRILLDRAPGFDRGV